MTSGTDLPDLARTRAAAERGIVEGLHLGAQVYVSLRGTGVGFSGVDLVVGERQPGQPMTADTLNPWLSATKPVVAVAVAILWERGLLDLDDPLARFVPELAAHGKGGITIRHALTHTGGFRMLDVGWPDASWDEIVARVAAAKPEPRWTPGRKAGYHTASSWYVLGEIVRRIDGRPLAAFLREEILLPLGMEDSWIGMPRERVAGYGDRLGHLYATEGTPPHDRGWHAAPYLVGGSPAGGGYGPMRELGRFYEMLLARGQSPAGHRILSPQTVEALTARHRVGMVDLTFRARLDWGLGFIVDSLHYGVDGWPYGFGRWASPRTFGHGGSQSSVAFADPEAGLVVAAFANGNPGESRHTERFRELAEAVYADLDLATVSLGAALG